MLLRSKPAPGLCALLLFTSSLTGAPPVIPGQAQRYTEHVKFLANPALEGRGAGTAGLERAGGYIESHFKRLGLQPAGDKGTYRQELTVPTGAAPGTGNHLAQTGSKALAPGQDYQPFSFSSSARQPAAGVVFAGYGATAPELGYDDYAGLDVKGRIVLVLRYEPEHFAKPQGGRPPRYTLHAHLTNKVINARDRGAAALVLVNSERGKDELIPFGQMAGPDNARFPVVQVKRPVADAWLSAAGTTLAALEAKINAGKAPASLALPDSVRVALATDVERKMAGVHNVLAYLPGRTDEYIVIGAHYDHIGYGHQSSLAPDQAGRAHPGADDNASGTAGLMELAQMLSPRKGQLQRGILFAAFAGEEVGLLGSEHWVGNPTLPLNKAVAMLNMDMIGRVSGSKLFIGGASSGSGLRELLDKVVANYDFKPDYTFKNATSSDHASFLSKNIPSLFFFSGIHADYHKPSDTWDKIEAAESSKVLNLVFDVTMGLMDAHPQFTKAPAAQPHQPPAERSSRGPVLGVTPDYAPGSKGVKIIAVASGSAAETAGIQPGDLVVALGAAPVRDLYDLTYAIHQAAMGSPAPLKVLRGGKELTLQVTLTRQ